MLYFFNTFFSKNKDIISFAKYLLNNNRRKEVQELNKAVKLFGNKIEDIVEFDPLTGSKTNDLNLIKLYAKSLKVA